ncbi:MAG: SMC-Scp complex subunit ScpB [Anaerolineae bacterium]
MSSMNITSQMEREGEKPYTHPLDLTSRIEALLFVADEPVNIRELARVLEVAESEVETALQQLSAQYKGRGLRLQRTDRQVQFVTAPEAASDVERFLGLDNRTRLSAAALETLALIAYRQPITRAQIEAIRGVNCDGVLRTLLSHGLIAAVGRLEQAGRPILYGTTFEFLQYFGLTDLSELPSLDVLRSSMKGGEDHAAGCAADAAPTNKEV